MAKKTVDSHLDYQTGRLISLEEREKISSNLKGIFERVSHMNPVYPHCMVLSQEFLCDGEINLAIDFFFQDMCNPKDQLVDIALHDLIYVLYVSRLLGSQDISIKDFQFLESFVTQLYG